VLTLDCVDTGTDQELLDGMPAVEDVHRAPCMVIVQAHDWEKLLRWGKQKHSIDKSPMSVSRMPKLVA
jgi:hypothetical protein